MTIKDVTAAVRVILGNHRMTKSGKGLQLTVVAALFAFLIGILGSAPAAWAVFPDHSIKLIIPSPPGSGMDVSLRTMIDNLLPILGQPVVIESRPGSNGILAAQLVAKAKPDGYTILFGLNQTHGTNSCMFSDLPYDPIKDFVPIINLYQSYPVLVVSAKLPVYSVAELIAYGKAHPGLKFASTGVGGPVHLGAVDFANRVGIKLTHIPYTNMGEMLTDLGNGEVSLLVYSYGPIKSSIDAGKLRLLATTAPKRVPALPNVPTVMEAGVPNFTGGTFNALFAPAGTPKNIIQMLYDAFEKAMKDAAVIRYFELNANVIDVKPKTSDELAKFLPGEIERVCKIVEAAGAKVR